MSLQTILPWLLVGMLMSTFGMVLGVSRGSPNLALFAAAAFALFIVIVAVKTNMPYWRQTNSSLHDKEAAVAARRNARLMATCYNWGAIALLAIYTLTPLRWQHGWQYAMAMVLLGGICFTFALSIGRAGGGMRATILRVAAMATAVQGVLAACGLVYLVGAGKLTSSRADWAANDIFLFGGIAITALSACALRTHSSFKG